MLDLVSWFKNSIQTVLARAGCQLCRKDLILLYTLIQLDRKQVPRLLYFKRMYDRIRSVPGDIVECGLGQTRTFQILALLMEAEDADRTLYGFDSFEGFPEPTLEDHSPRQPRKGEWKVITLTQAYQMLRMIRLDQEFIDRRIKIVKGFFNDTLTSAPVSTIALLHLDVDLYGSYQTCLREFFPRLAEGGMVLFDEYDSANYPGARKAIDEYFAGQPYRLERDLECGKYFLVKIAIP